MRIGDFDRWAMRIFIRKPLRERHGKVELDGGRLFLKGWALVGLRRGNVLHAVTRRVDAG